MKSLLIKSDWFVSKRGYEPGRMKGKKKEGTKNSEREKHMAASGFLTKDIDQEQEVSNQNFALTYPVNLPFLFTLLLFLRHQCYRCSAFDYSVSMGFSFRKKN